MKKNYALLLTLICLFALKSSAQESIIGQIDYKTLDKYIQAAREYYPKRKIQEAQTGIAKIGVTTANLSYLDIINASYFYRPGDKTAISVPGGTGTTANPYVFNGVQLGIGLNLGGFLQKPFLVKRARAEYKVAKLQQEDYDISLDIEVKRKYYTYIQSLSELKIKTQTAQESRTVADNASKRFQNGQISLDEYNNSRRILADANTDQISTEVIYLTSKDDLEAIIGKKLTDIK